MRQPHKAQQQKKKQKKAKPHWHLWSFGEAEPEHALVANGGEVGGGCTPPTQVTRVVLAAIVVVIVVVVCLCVCVFVSVGRVGTFASSLLLISNT